VKTYVARAAFELEYEAADAQAALDKLNDLLRSKKMKRLRVVRATGCLAETSVIEETTA
jgi:uncharacterized protein YjbK